MSPLESDSETPRLKGANQRALEARLRARDAYIVEQIEREDADASAATTAHVERVENRVELLEHANERTLANLDGMLREAKALHRARMRGAPRADSDY